VSDYAGRGCVADCEGVICPAAAFSALACETVDRAAAWESTRSCGIVSYDRAVCLHRPHSRPVYPAVLARSDPSTAAVPFAALARVAAESRAAMSPRPDHFRSALVHAFLELSKISARQPSSGAAVHFAGVTPRGRYFLAAWSTRDIDNGSCHLAGITHDAVLIDKLHCGAIIRHVRRFGADRASPSYYIESVSWIPP